MLLFRSAKKVDSDGQPILRVNGIQTQSEIYPNLFSEARDLEEMGVTHMRLMPQAVDMARIAQVFRDTLDETLEVTAAEERLLGLCGSAIFSNGFFHGTAGYRRTAAAAPA